MTLSALRITHDVTPTHEMVSPDQLIIDPRVQRKEGVSGRRVATMVSAFDPNALGTITVSRRKNGHLVVLDGAHRTEAARQVEHGSLRALVFDGLTLAQEAAMFDLLNTFAPPSLISKVLARVVAGDRESTDIANVIGKHGWRISPDSNNGNFAAINAAQRVYRDGAGTLSTGEHIDLLDHTIGLITTTWNRDRESAHQMLVLGIGQLLGRFGDAVDLTKMSKSLAQERPYVIIGRAKAVQAGQGGTTAAATAKVLVGIHNKGRRINLLPEWVWTR